MKNVYLRPVIVNAGTLEITRTDHDGIFPAVQALAAGYQAGKVVKKVFGGAIPNSILNSLVKRKEFSDREK